MDSFWTKGVFQGPVDDPNGPGATIINGINDGAFIVGFYGVCVSAPVGATTCNGFVGTPKPKLYGLCPHPHFLSRGHFASQQMPDTDSRKSGSCRRHGDSPRFL